MNLSRLSFPLSLKNFSVCQSMRMCVKEKYRGQEQETYIERNREIERAREREICNRAESIIIDRSREMMLKTSVKQEKKERR